MDLEILRKYEERKAAMKQRLEDSFSQIIKEHDISFDQEYMRMAKLLIPMDSNYSRLSPIQCNLFLSNLVLILNELYAKVIMTGSPFKMVYQRPFTYVISRGQLDKARPRLYPLDFPEAPENASSAEQMKKLYKRFLTGLAMLNFNVVHLASFLGIFVERELEWAQPIRILGKLAKLEKIVDASFELYRLENYTFNDIFRQTIEQWNQQTGSNLSIAKIDKINPMFDL